MFDEDLTGGVHNAFAMNDYLYAISGGQKYIIIDVKDVYKPKRVGEYRYPGARIHDLCNGIAYSAQGGIGAVIVDLGNGKWGRDAAESEVDQRLSDQLGTRDLSVFPEEH